MLKQVNLQLNKYLNVWVEHKTEDLIKLKKIILKVNRFYFLTSFT